MPGFTVTGTTYVDAPLKMVLADLSFGASGSADGWYWEAGMSPPFNWPSWQTGEPAYTEGKLSSPQNRLSLQNYPYASFLDRVDVDGMLIKFKMVESTAEAIGVKANTAASLTAHMPIGGGKSPLQLHFGLRMESRERFNSTTEGSVTAALGTIDGCWLASASIDTAYS